MYFFQPSFAIVLFCFCNLWLSLIYFYLWSASQTCFSVNLLNCITELVGIGQQHSPTWCQHISVRRDHWLGPAEVRTTVCLDGEARYLTLSGMKKVICYLTLSSTNETWYLKLSGMKETPYFTLYSMKEAWYLTLSGMKETPYFMLVWKRLSFPILWAINY